MRVLRPRRGLREKNTLLSTWSRPSFNRYKYNTVGNIVERVVWGAGKSHLRSSETFVLWRKIFTQCFFSSATSLFCAFARSLSLSKKTSRWEMLNAISHTPILSVFWASINSFQFGKLKCMHFFPHCQAAILTHVRSSPESSSQWKHKLSSLSRFPEHYSYDASSSLLSPGIRSCT